MTYELALIIPLHNEAENLETLYFELLQNVPENHQIVFVDDASEDQSPLILEKIKSSSNRVHILRMNKKIGLGLSILEGIRFSDSNVILVMDSDLTHNPDEIPKMLDGLTNSSLIVNSRYVSKGIKKPYSIYLTSKLFAILIRSFFQIQTKDIFGGFIAFRRRDFEEFFVERNFNGFGEYSMRLCLFAEKKNLPICELPSVFRPRAGGTKKSRRIRMFFSYVNATRLYKSNLREDVQ